MDRRLGTVLDVASRRLCAGCGACAYVAGPALRMVDVPESGLRPVADAPVDDRTAAEALAVCPGADQSFEFVRDDPSLLPGLAASWGPVLEIWEGFATDPELRHRASSGGAASALAAYCIERGGMHGVLHIAARADAPHLNETVLSTTREQIRDRSGSRYAPASPCDGLGSIEAAPAPCVFIGKPCDCLAVAKTRRIRPALDAKVGLVIGIFCAGTPTTAGTLAMLRRMGIEDPARLRGLRYRGDGWPGRATAVVETEGGVETRTLSYAESWGEILAQHKQWRCNLCPDRTGESADVSVGDPWWGGVPEDAPGRSLVVVRTERGRRVVREARDAGHLRLEPAEPWKLRASQPAFPRVRGQIGGRLAVLRAFGVAVPRYSTYGFLRHWTRELTFGEKVRSLVGTARRVFSKRLLRPEPPPVVPAGRVRGRT